MFAGVEPLLEAKEENKPFGIFELDAPLQGKSDVSSDSGYNEQTIRNVGKCNGKSI